MKLSGSGLFWALVIVLCGIMTGEKALAATAEVSWSANPSEDEVAGYRVYYGTASGRYIHVESAGQNTQAYINGLQEGVTYYFAVTAYDASFNESEYSDEIFLSIPNPQIELDTDSDGIPDMVESSVGLDPINPFDSLYDNDLDGYSNFTEYVSNTDMNDFLSIPERDSYMIYMIAEKGSTVALDGIIPETSLNIVPVSSEYPVPVDLVLNLQTEGLFYYNLINSSGSVKYKLNISVTGSILMAAQTSDEESISVIDSATGIELEIPEGSSSDEIEVGIGISLVQSGPQNAVATPGYVFDILPYGKTLKQPAKVAVPYSGESPQVELYDFTTEKWAGIKDKAMMDNGRAVFTTKTLGRFRIIEALSQTNSETETLSADDSGSSGSGGGCFISSAFVS
jgi:hypothetical protein